MKAKVDLVIEKVGQRARSNTYRFHAVVGPILVWLVENPAIVSKAVGFALTGPQALVISAVGGMIIREFTDKPLSAK